MIITEQQLYGIVLTHAAAFVISQFMAGCVNDYEKCNVKELMTRRHVKYGLIGSTFAVSLSFMLVWIVARELYHWARWEVRQLRSSQPMPGGTQQPEEGPYRTAPKQCPTCGAKEGKRGLG